MIKTLPKRAARTLFAAGFGLSLLLLGIRHYYEARTLTILRTESQSVIQTTAVLNHTIELTLELSEPADEQVNDSTARLIYQRNRLLRNATTIRPLLDSLVMLTRDKPGLNTLARRVQAEAQLVLRAGEEQSATFGRQLQQLVRLLRTLRLALADDLLVSQQQTRTHLATMRAIDNVIDGLILLVTPVLLVLMYRYTQRRDQLTQHVLERQKQLTQYLEAIPEGVVVMNTNRQIVFVNGAGNQLLSTTPDDLPIDLADWASRFRKSEADGAALYPAGELPLSRALRGETTSVEDLYLKTETDERLLAAQAQPLYGRQGDIVGAIAIIRDITQARRQAEELQRAYTLTEQSLREREIFLANISHDIRTPLNAILGFAELLLQRQPSPNEQAYLDGIRLSGNNLLTLIDELLDLSKIDSGQLVLEPVPTVLADVIRSVEANVALQAAQKGLECIVLADPALPSVLRADPLRLTQVLMSFCSNAVRFTRHGFVRLLIRTEATGTPGHIQLVFSVQDSGVGIAEDKLATIFNRFSRMADDTLFRSGGTGLSLNIAHSLITLMNGNVTVKSHPGRGTTFTIRLPFEVLTAAPPVTDTRPVTTAEARPQQTTVDVLIVEDNVLNQRVLDGFLQRHQLQPTVVNNGLEAVNLLRTRSFDLIFMDIQMPEMDGYTATRVIRQQLNLTIPIIAMTAYTMAGERERCLAEGMNEYLAKPIRMEQIDQLLMRFAPTFSLQTVRADDAPPAEASKEPINRRYLNEVTGGDNELLAELVTLFRQELPEYRQLLFGAIEANDWPAFKKTAHKFRSSLNSLAMLPIAEAMKELECSEQPLDVAMSTRLTQLFADIQQGVTLLETLLTEQRASEAPGQMI